MRPLATRPRPALNPLALLALLLLPLLVLAAGCAVDRAGAAVEALEAERVVLSPDDGDDAVLDRLWDECAAAVEGACEELYWSSPVGSSYERFSASR